MKMLVFSDSHRILTHMVYSVKIEQPDYIIHLGDHTRDADVLREHYPDVPMISVRGNCDFDYVAPEQLLQEWDGVRIFMTHGHLYDVKSNLLRIALAAKERQADIVLFGHTHLPICIQKAGMQLLNPGSCGGRTPTYGVIEITNGVPDITIKNANERSESK